MDRELFRNGSGYADPTAYRAMITMEEKNMETKPFEVWKYEISTGEKMGIVMAQEGNIISVLPLFDRPFAGGIEITTVQGVRFVHPIRMAHVGESKLISYVQDVPEDSVRDIAGGFCKIYADVMFPPINFYPCGFGPDDPGSQGEPGMPGPVGPKGISGDFEASQQYNTGDIVYIEHLGQFCRISDPKEMETLRTEIEGERREKEVYKGLYESLLDKLIK